MGANDREQSRKEDRKVERRGSKPGEGVWRGYINVNLTADLKAQFEAWVHTDDVWLALAEGAVSGCQVGLKYVGGEGTFLASLTQRTAGHVNEGLCVTARSSRADLAIMRVLFLYRVLGSDASWEAVQPLADPDRW